MSDFRVVIIGAGAMGDVYAQCVNKIAGAKVVGGSSRSKEKGAKFAEKFGCEWFDDTARMLDATKPDLAIIATPSGAHLEPALACIARRVAIACTKPLEITTARCDQMIDAAKKANVTVAGLFPLRFAGSLLAIYDAAKQGRFGTLATIATYTPWWREDAYYAPSRWQGKLALDGGGAVINQSIHGIDAMQWLAAATMPELPREKNPVKEIFAFTGKRGHDPNLIEVEDTAVAVARFQNGAVGQMLCCTSMYPGTLKRIQIGGRDGTAEIVESSLVQFDFRTPRPDDRQTLQKWGAKPETSGASDPMKMSHVEEIAQLQVLIDALRAKNPIPIDAVEARKSVAIINALYESAATGKCVAVR